MTALRNWWARKYFSGSVLGGRRDALKVPLVDVLSKILEVGATNVLGVFGSIKDSR